MIPRKKQPLLHLFTQRLDSPDWLEGIEDIVNSALDDIVHWDRGWHSNSTHDSYECVDITAPDQVELIDVIIIPEDGRHTFSEEEYEGFKYTIVKVPVMKKRERKSNKMAMITVYTQSWGSDDKITFTVPVGTRWDDVFIKYACHSHIYHDKSCIAFYDGIHDNKMNSEDKVKETDDILAVWDE